MSALPWFRMYHRMVDDEKLRLLAFEDRWHFVALCCLKADGLLDTPDDSLRSRKIAVKLGVQLRELDEIGRRLQEVGLIDTSLSPIAWDELQFRSDHDATAARRQREKRNRDKVLPDVTDVSRVTVTDVTRLDTESDTDIEVVTKVTTPRLRASRLADAWTPKPLPEKLMQLVSQWPDGRAERELDGFRDYWNSRQRDSARKDWDLVWHNRIRDQHDRIMRDGKQYLSTTANGMGVTERAARQAMHEIAGGFGRFEDCREQVRPGNGQGSGRAIDAVPDTVRAIGYAGG